MARANRLRGGGREGGVFHITHRCHNREFLLKFARDRNVYREKLREHLKKFRVWLLDYCITSNHGHILIDAEDRLEVSRFMQEVASEFAREYNRRKGRENAFWGDNFHATLVECGRHQWECHCYIALNMIRCGVVKHPREWEWLGYHEIMGLRRRYRLIDLDRLCWRLGAGNLEEVRRNLEASLAERIARDRMEREPRWTESLAVGSAGFVEKIKPLILSRQQTEVVEAGKDFWVLKEQPAIPYSQKTGAKSDAKPVL
ncbi:MAG: transposase [Candidatus Omnitrophica bacterium]|nr:transposase [Candidatus Omnitrophota bacterium]